MPAWCALQTPHFRFDNGADLKPALAYRQGRDQAQYAWQPSPLFAGNYHARQHHLLTLRRTINRDAHTVDSIFWQAWNLRIKMC